MAKTTYKSTEGLIKKLQRLKGKTKLKLYQNKINYYDEKNNKRQINTLQFEENPFGKNVQGIGKINHEVLLLKNFSETNHGLGL